LSRAALAGSVPDEAMIPRPISLRPARRARLLVLALALFSLQAAAAEWRSLWNGRDLAEWTTWLARPEPTSEVPGLTRGPDGRYLEPIGSNTDPLKVFTVVTMDGAPALRVSGEVFGEIRSRVSLQNYHLRFQFKWGEKKWPPRAGAGTPRDSGLLYHVHSEPGAEGRTWARSIELQIQERDVGDLYSIGASIFVRSRLRAGTGRGGVAPVFDYDPTGDWIPYTQAPGMSGRCVKQPDNEKPNGEWNTVELICLGEEAIHIVNGKVVMRLQGPRQINTPLPQPVTSGPIIFLSEGAELFYRDISYRPISAVPPEFVAARN
jgi:hypothetical protein